MGQGTMFCGAARSAFIAFAALLALAACGGGGGVDEPGNTFPTANAGAGQTVVSGAAVTLNGTASSDPDGSVASYAWTQTLGASVTLTGANTAQPTFVAPTVTSGTNLQFSLVVTDNRGANSTAATVTIMVVPVSSGVVTLGGTVRYTRVRFHANSPYGLNYSDTVLLPSRGVVVRAVDAANQSTVLASGVTEADGSYSLSVPGNTNVAIQVEARLLRDASVALPRWNVRVQNGQGNLTPYRHTSAGFNSSVGTQNVDIPSGLSTTGTATGTRASGPFAILDTIYTAMQTVVEVAPSTNFPMLFIDWGTQSAGTQFDPNLPQNIQLLSDLTEDTDEFDQHVVAHEFGHYLEHNFSRSDSIGGSHSLGQKLDMRVAFGEGFGYAFAAIVLNNPDVRDSFVSGATQAAGRFNVETNPPATSGAVGTSIGCWCSESSVWSILWDLYDPVNDDSLAIGFGPIWNVLIGPQRETPAMTSIFPFIAALKLEVPAQAAAINALVAAQNIDAATIDAFATMETHAPTTPPPANTPFPNSFPLYASIAPGSPVVVRTTDDGGRYNKAGNHRFLRFTPSSSGTVNVSVVTSNMNVSPNAADPDFVVYSEGELVALHQSAPSAEPARTETGQVPVTAGLTYIIDAYDCANGCVDEEGVPGDYDLTVTIN